MTNKPNRQRPLALIILDGWGHSDEYEHNAIAQAHTPHWDHWWKTASKTLLQASGGDVGLPQDQMGNSEVGHMHIGAGRIVHQDYTRINQAIDDGSFQSNPTLLKAARDAKASGKAIHIMGLLSEGGVHSHQDHLFSLLQTLHRQGVNNVYVHAFLDGRDTPPKCAEHSLHALQTCLNDNPCGQLASLSGRYYAMDRDQRWERIQSVYDMLTQEHAERQSHDLIASLANAYQQGLSDEFILPTRAENTPPITDGDSVIFTNFRADRARQLSRALLNRDFEHFERQTFPSLAHFISFTHYADDIASEVAFPSKSLDHTLGECIAEAGLRQLRIAETEKYAHVTFFINGGSETVFPGETRQLIPSPQVATYDLQPEMHADIVCDNMIEQLKSGNVDVVICNFANADMVGHSGNFEATIKAVECLDRCLSRIADTMASLGGDILITADHGNAEKMHDQHSGQAHTAHTEQPVPLIHLGRSSVITRPLGSLIDIAPTMLYLLGLEIPKEMTGKPLVKLQESE